jgi:CarD family transcriptional regulator
MSKENHMMLSVGKTIVNPYQGPCLIGAVMKKTVGGKPTSFYQLARLDEIGGALLVPVDKIGGLRIRQLTTRSDIPKVLRRLKKPAATVMSWKQRAIDNLNLLASGSPFDLADVVESLTELNEARTLSPRDREMLDRARRILICEISEVMGETKSAAEQQVGQALNMRKKHKATGRKKVSAPDTTL